MSSVDRGADACLDSEGRTALMWAASRGDCAVVEFLISKGADVNRADAKQWSTLHWAVTSKSAAVVRLVLRSGATVDARQIVPTHSTHSCTFHSLSKRGVWLQSGATPLMMATSGEALPDVVLALLQFGADPNLEDEVRCSFSPSLPCTLYEMGRQRGDTPLMSASRGGSVRAAESLLAFGANVDPQNKVVPLHSAIRAALMLFAGRVQRACPRLECGARTRCGAALSLGRRPRQLEPRRLGWQLWTCSR